MTETTTTGTTDGNPHAALRDGVYLGLSEADYFAQGRIGSTDLVKLWQQGLGYWWQSPFNPHRKEPDRDYLDRGHALHCRLLEGAEAYATRFAIEPDPAAYPGLLKTVDDIRRALSATGSPIPSGAKKADFLHYARTYMSSAPLWDDIMSAFWAEHEGQTLISADVDRYIGVILDAIEREPTLATLLDPEGERLTEVSVFWTPPGGRPPMRFRFDGLFPDFVLDLKGIETTTDAFRPSVGKRIRNFHMDVQLALSFEARAAMNRLIAAGKLHGGTPQQRRWIRRFPKDAADPAAWAWLWLFTQWPNEQTGRAPEILPIWVQHGDELHREGLRKYLAASDTYRQAVSQFGTDRPWGMAHAVHGLRGTGPQLQLPPDYGPPVMPHPDEDRFLNPESPT